MSLAALNMGDYSLSLTWCNMQLTETVEPNIKIIYRKASANKGLKNWEDAKEDIRFGI